MDFGLHHLNVAKHDALAVLGSPVRLLSHLFFHACCESWLSGNLHDGGCFKSTTRRSTQQCPHLQDCSCGNKLLKFKMQTK